LQDKSIAKCNALQYNNVLQNYNSWRTLTWSIRSLLNFKEKNIGFRQEIIIEQKIGARKEHVIFIGLFGNLKMAVKFLRGTISTISTLIRSIMTFPTLNWCMVQNIQGSILTNELQKEPLTTYHPCYLLGKQQDLGMERQKVSNGTVKMGRNVGKTGKCIQSIASFVAKKLKLLFQQEQNSAGIFVKSKQDIEAVRTSLRDRVLFVVQTLKHINIIKLKLAPRVVRISQYPELCDTYNITVEQDHVYYANGILACNCDSLEYLCLYIDEKQEYDKQKKEFLAKLKHQQPHHPASRTAGY
jgi:hypothetical protein